MTTPSIKEAFIQVLASLAAAISILDRTPRSKKAVASDTMFDISLNDYRKALEAGRSALITLQPSGERREAIARIIDPMFRDPLALSLNAKRNEQALAKADALIASSLVQDEALMELKRELQDCQNAVATIGANLKPNNETQSGNYRFYQGRVVSLQFVIKVIEGK